MRWSVEFDESEIEPGDSPLEAAEQLLLEVPIEERESVFGADIEVEEIEERERPSE